MIKITKLDLFLSLITAVLLPIAFVIPYAGILSWFLLVPFFIAIENKSSRDSFKLGILTGTIANGIATYWLIGTISRFGGFPFVISIIFHLIISMYSGLLLAVFAYITTKLDLFRKPGLLSALLIAAVWTSLEFFFPYLFPYGVTNSQADYLLLIQIYDLLGMYSLSFLIVLVNVTVMRAIKRLAAQSPTPTPEILASLALLTITIVYGFWRIEVMDREIAEAAKIKVGIVQANFDFLEKTENNQETMIEAHKTMSESFASPDLIVWPETAIQSWIPVSSDFLGNGSKAFTPKVEDSYFLVGGLSYEFDKTDGGVIQFNTAFLADSQGEILGRYNKIKLLLFGERLPFTGYFPSLKKLSPATGDFTPGDKLNLLEIKEKGIKIAPLICYEDIIPSFSGEFADEGANLLVNMTNDAWFGKTFEPELHLSISIPRAVETRLYLIRATNTGISAIVDPVGRVVAKTDIFERTTLEGQVGIMNGEKTLYTKIGNVFPWGCLVFWVGFVGLTKLQKLV